MKSHLLIIGILIVLMVPMVQGALSVSLVNQNPDPGDAGDLVELRLAFENTGKNPIEDIVMQIIPTYPFSIPSGQASTINVGTLTAYQSDEQSKIVKFKVKIDPEASAGTYSLTVGTKSANQDVMLEQSIMLDVRNKESAEIIHIDKTDLLPGKNTNLTFRITNVGSSSLRDLSFSWQNEDSVILPVGSDNMKYINNLDVGQSQDVTYEVVADSDAVPGLYRLDLSLAYEESSTGSDKVINTIAGIYVGGATDFDVSYSDTSDGETSFSIANIGSNPSYSVVVSVPNQDGWAVTGSSSAIIGNLDKGDYTVASYTIQRKPTDNRQLQSTIDIRVDYTDTKGARQTVIKEVDYGATTSTANATQFSSNFRQRGTFVQQSSPWDQYRWYILGFAALVLLFVFRGWYRKKKMRNPQFRLFRRR